MPGGDAETFAIYVQGVVRGDAEKFASTEHAYAGVTIRPVFVASPRPAGPPEG